jgi:hypothetical protein
MHYSVNTDEIKTEIEKLFHKVTNISNIKQYRTEVLHYVFFIELVKAPNNKHIFNVEKREQCKTKFQRPKHKKDVEFRGI